VSALARSNGWRGFDNIGERVEKGHFGYPPERGGWLYRCDGMSRITGCGEEWIVTRRLALIGKKKSGWLVIYGGCFPDEESDDGNGNDLDVVLTFCPSCAAVVTEQMSHTEPTEEKK